MTLPRKIRLFICLASLSILALALTARSVALDATLEGDLSVTHPTDPTIKLEISGTNTSNPPGMWLNYLDGESSTVTFGLNHHQGEWHWQIATLDLNENQEAIDRLQMKLSSANALSLFHPGDDTRSIIIDPEHSRVTIDGESVVTANQLADGTVPIQANDLVVRGNLSVGGEIRCFRNCRRRFDWERRDTSTHEANQ